MALTCASRGPNVRHKGHPLLSTSLLSADRHSRRIRPAAIGGVALLASAAIWAALSAWRYHQPWWIGKRHLRFFDLHVYRAGAHALLHGAPLYAPDIYRGMQFTYPPFSALAMVPADVVSLSLAAALSVVVNLGCLATILWLTPRLWDRAARYGWATVGLLAAALVWSEPVSTTIGYGQIDLVVAALLVWDLSRGAGSRWAGLGIGLAAGLKLTPLLFIPYLLLAGDRRRAGAATLSFAVTAAIGWAVAPGESSHYWGSLVLSSSRTGDVSDAANQSLTGLITRLTGSHHPSPGWLAVDVLVAAIGVGLAARAARAGERGVGFGLCALTSLLVSPVSWTHHWVLMVPAGLAVWEWARRRGALWPQALLVALAAAGFAYLPPQLAEGAPVALNRPEQLATMPYVVLGCALLASLSGFRPRLAELPVARRRGRSAGEMALEHSGVPAD